MPNLNKTPTGNLPIAPARLGRAAFTLVELLVVLGIIAVLISILLPTMQNVRRQAKVISCGSNLRQMGTVLHMYANDFHDCLPYNPTPADSSTKFTWNNQGAFVHHRDSANPKDLFLPRYTSGNWAVFFCPAPLRADAEFDPQDTSYSRWGYFARFYGETLSKFSRNPNTESIVYGLPDNRTPIVFDASYPAWGAGSPYAGLWANHVYGDIPLGQNQVYADGHVAWILRNSAGDTRYFGQ